MRKYFTSLKLEFESVWPILLPDVIKVKTCAGKLVKMPENFTENMSAEFLQNN